jgi:hypothetical protein
MLYRVYPTGVWAAEQCCSKGLPGRVCQAEGRVLRSLEKLRCHRLLVCHRKSPLKASDSQSEKSVACLA